MLGVVASVLLAFACPLLAQVTADHSTLGATLNAGAATVTVDNYSNTSALSTFSTISGSAGRFTGDLTGSISRFETGHFTTYGEAHTATRFAIPAFNLSAWSVDAGAGSYRGSVASDYVKTEVQLGRLNSDQENVWANVGLGRAGDTTAFTTAHAGVGASTQFSTISAGAAANLVHGAGATYADLAVRTEWKPQRQSGCEAAGRIDLQLDGGIRAGTDVGGRRAWVATSGSIALPGSAALILAAGIEPPDRERATVGVTYASATLRLSFGTDRSRLAVAELIHTNDARSEITIGDVGPDGARTLRIRATGAHELEIMGDFSNWRPMAMTKSSGGSWLARVVLTPGTHRINVRVDGGDWHAPRGLPALADDFGGSVGILIIQ